MPPRPRRPASAARQLMALAAVLGFAAAASAQDRTQLPACPGDPRCPTISLDSPAVAAPAPTMSPRPYGGARAPKTKDQPAPDRAAYYAAKAAHERAAQEALAAKAETAKAETAKAETAKAETVKAEAEKAEAQSAVDRAAAPK